MKVLVMMIALTAVCCGTPKPAAPPLLDQRIEQTPDGRYMVISLREPVSAEQIQAAIDEHRDTVLLVRTFTYANGLTPGKDKPTALYQWTRPDGLRKVY